MSIQILHPANVDARDPVRNAHILGTADHSTSGSSNCGMLFVGNGMLDIDGSGHGDRVTKTGGALNEREEPG